jgi:hypothetical protein
MYYIIIFWSYCVSIRSARLCTLYVLLRVWNVGGVTDTIYRASTSISRLLLIYSDEMGVRSEGERNTELIRRLGGIRCDAPVVIEVFRWQTTTAVTDVFKTSSNLLH